MTVKNPYVDANPLSKLLASWMSRFFRLRTKRELELSDLYETVPDESSEVLGSQLGQFWNDEILRVQVSNCNLEKGKKPYKPSLRRAILRLFWTKYIFLGIFACFEECVLRIVQPLLLACLIRYFGGTEFRTIDGWFFAAGVSITAIFSVLIHHPYFFAIQRIGSKVRIACCSMIYRKALRLDQLALSETTIGQMVNLLSNDVNRFDQSTLFIHYLWIAPLQTVIATIILWDFFGPTCLVGVLLLLLFVPFQGFMGKCFSKLRIQTAEKTDARIRVMNEFLNGIRVIKMYAWEIPFSALVADRRRDEVKVIRRTNHFRAVNMGIFFIGTKIIIFLTFLVYVITGNALTAEKVFVTVSLFNNIRVTVTLFMPSAVSQLAEALVSIRRLETFLLLKERPVSCSNDPKVSTVTTGEISIENVRAKWNPKYEEDTLSDINLKVRPGQLVAIIGQFGVGKSSLLQTILKELSPSQGHVEVNGSVGYAAQEPWIVPGSVKENILFGTPFDPDWYEKVITACALVQDLTLFPYGDETLLGDKGSSLSGGQRARVALCRAVYSNADIYLLDDPLSAVDAEVGKHIFEKCINGILRGKTRILVTHQLQFLPKVDRIVLMENGGKIRIESSHEDLMESELDLANYLQSPIIDTEADPGSADLTPLKSFPVVRSRRRRTFSEGSESSRYSVPRVESMALGESCLLGHMCSHEEIYHLAVDHYDDELPTSESGQNVASATVVDSNRQNGGGETVRFLPKIVDESKASGQVRWSLYWKFFRSGSNPFVLLGLLGISVLTQVLVTGCDFWLNLWTEAEDIRISGGDFVENDSTKNRSSTSGNNLTLNASTFIANFDDWAQTDYLIVYTLFVVFFSVFAIFRSWLFFKVCMDASVGIHNSSFHGILRAPVKFFEVNPLGRILNRFSKDFGCIDDVLPLCFFDAFVIFLNVAGIMLLLACVNPFLLLPGTALAVIFLCFRTYFLNTARSVKRLEGIARSPVFSHLSSTLQGLTTIRAYGVESQFIQQFDQHQDLHTSAWFLLVASRLWFGIRLDLLSSLFISVVTFSFMATAEGGSGPEVGLAISSVLALSGMFQWGLRQSAEVSNQMVSVERIMDYTTLQPEAPLSSTPDKKPPHDWPNQGKLEFKKVTLRYTDDPKPVLNNLSLVINSCEKIGIVGRTGAGKSSILSTLFRIVEPTGQIFIDDVNILEIGLHDLRSKISIIPQDPVLFTGSVRKNLDPFQEYSDDEIWNVLKTVHLIDAIELPGGLETQVAEGGSTLSLGERQMMCLGRAILRKNKILVLDEATANVDPETDVLIQATIREKFQDCTVLTIAHRLNTVMDSDKILFLDAGTIKEFDHPYLLLQNEASALYHLVKETGDVSFDNLFETAKVAYCKNSED